MLAHNRTQQKKSTIKLRKRTKVKQHVCNKNVQSVNQLASFWNGIFFYKTLSGIEIYFIRSDQKNAQLQLY